MGLEDFYSGWREGGVEGLESGFADRLYAMFTAMPPELSNTVTINSGYRDVDAQTELWEAALDKYGSPEAARKWVAPPGKSNHNRGLAADLAFASNAARRWIHDNAERFGLAFHLSNEDWHIEPAGLRSGEYMSSGQTYGDIDHDHEPTYVATSADPEAYTDGEGLWEVDNTSIDVQMKRLADMIGTRNQRTGIRQADPTQLAKNNMQLDGAPDNVV